jgi:hypothetical protein
MSKETDTALKNLIVEILDNLTTDDVLANAGINPNGRTRKSADSSLRKMKAKMGAVSAELDAIAQGGRPYKKTYIKDIRTVEDMRINGRQSKEGIITPIHEWGCFELLSYFLELYYKRTGHEFPIDEPGITYSIFVKASGQWEKHLSRGLSVMTRIVKAFGGAEQAIGYINWWFTASFNNKSVSWGWLANAGMIADYESYLSAPKINVSSAPIAPDSPLPEDFVEWVSTVPEFQNYTSGLKTLKQLKYIYNAWEDKLSDDSSDHPVLVVLREAVKRKLIGVLS